MKTTLAIEIEYDPQKTGPEALASAMDRLLETALSTPGILEEYGNPAVGKFYVAEAQPMAKAPRVVVSVCRGMVEEVFASDPTTEIAIIDWDAEGAIPGDPGVVTAFTQDGMELLAYVAQCGVEPLERMAGTDEGQILRAAGLDPS